MRATVEEFLTVVSHNKMARFAEITSHHVEEPGGKKVLRKSRVTKQPTPYASVTHILRRNVLLGASYQDMVNKQRGKEAEAALAELSAELPFYVKLTAELEPFIAAPLWNGKGKRDDVFPKFAAQHIETGERHLIFWPRCDAKGDPVISEDRYLDQDGKELDFKKDVEEYWAKKTFVPSKVQGTERAIRWGTVKFGNVVQIKANGLVWDIERPVIRALG